MVSKDVSRWLTKRIGKVAIGHVGTLDPLAEGLLPVLLGSATKLQDYLLALPKTYLVDCKFGEETDTLDLEGRIQTRRPHEHITDDLIGSTTKQFLGHIEQTPPLYSAVKLNGRPLYDYARQGEGASVDFERLTRKVRIYSYEFLEYRAPIATLRVTCSKGTYIRVLISDLAKAMGTCATMTRLVRENSSGISLGSGHRLEEIEAKIEEFQSILLPIDEIDIGLPRWTSGQGELDRRLSQGQVVKVSKEIFCRNLAASRFQAVFDDVGGEGSGGVVLVSVEGKVFGIGAIAADFGDEIKICMKRGFA